MFGRVAPEQKERIVVSLRRQGRYVAMIGDGVNDARALKGAQVGVAMRSGSAVTRDVADIVLVDDSFAALLPAQREGRRIINGIAVSMYSSWPGWPPGRGIIAGPDRAGLYILAHPVGLTCPVASDDVLTFWADRPARRASAGTLARLSGAAAIIHRRLGTASTPTSTSGSPRGSLGPNPAQVIREFESYTGRLHRSEFTVAAATIGAQPGLSTLASWLLLYLFPRPPAQSSPPE